MISIGLFNTKEGKSYDCHFIPENSLVQAVGPLPPPGEVGARGVVFETNAESKEEAIKKIEKAIEQGILK